MEERSGSNRLHFSYTKLTQQLRPLGILFLKQYMVYLEMLLRTNGIFVQIYWGGELA
jgi:hypothetical protein